MNRDCLEPNEKITTEQFVVMLLSSCVKMNLSELNQLSDYIDYAFSIGIITDYDVINRKMPVERRSVARIIHETLLKEYNESDEVDWLGAERFSDLYDCHSCVNHIVQVYSKGIMTGKTDTFFDNYEFLTQAEAEKMIERMKDKKKRITVHTPEQNMVSEITPKEAFDIISAKKNVLLLDVRSEQEYKEGHINGSKSIPLENIRKNPYAVSENKNVPIILYCMKGYKSRLAAELLKKAGYFSVCIMPGIEQYEYELVK